MDCSICLEKTENILDCRHYTCITCLKRLIKKSNTCPLCRQIFNTEPYKYIPPKHTPNLRLSMKTKKIFNRFLSSRYLLTPNKHQRFYASLMSIYHNYIYVLGKYISLNTITKFSKYECLQFYLFFWDKKCIYNKVVQKLMREAIENYLCEPEMTSYINSLYSFIN